MLPQSLLTKQRERVCDPWQAAMKTGDFETAWQQSDLVLAARQQADRDNPLLPYHLRWVWDGRSLIGKHVLVRCYHGLGDTLQFCRFLRPLSRIAKSVTVEAQPELIDLLQSSIQHSRFIPFDPAKPATPLECDVEVMELAHALRAVPRPAPYLRIGRRLRRNGKLRVGVCGRAGHKPSDDRSVPSDLLAAMLSCRDVDLINLQLEGGVHGGVTGICSPSIIHTANVISELDLVISVDTMVAHLAGTMGLPVWLFLKADPDWRWVAGGTGSVWYAGIRKYQQSKSGEWEAPMRTLVQDFAEWIQVAGAAQRSRADTR